MNKRIRRVDGKNLYHPVSVIHPVMGNLRVNLHAVSRIQAIFYAVQKDGQNAFQNIDEFFPLVSVHFQIIRAGIGEGHQMEDPGQAGKISGIAVEQILNNLRADL